MSATNEQALQELEELQQEVGAWFQRTSNDLKSMHAKFTQQIRQMESQCGGAPAGGNGTVAPAPQQAPKAGGMDWESLVTPSRTPQRPAAEQRTPSMASPPVSHALSYDALIEDSGVDKKRTGAEDRNRPTPDQVQSEAQHAQRPSDRNQPCQVLVEFKRKRILQFESPQYVAPGEYVVVGGDRGEDIGLVTHTWTSGGAPPTQGRYSSGSGMGKVTRLATVLEVSQLQGVQTELETRAVEVAQEKVVEHQLPMRIVDAEYQFDRKKLTFYYQSQHRLDFRNLVRDLYKTFRARIWMELD